MEQQPILIEGRVHDLGDGFNVRRLLPVLQARHVGPFVFFDYMGPVTFLDDKGMDVRPHPHIGLATVTWLFDGVIRHRDSLGSIADIRPGEVNWMTSGRGIVHSERTPPEARGGGAWMVMRRCTPCRLACRSARVVSTSLLHASRLTSNKSTTGYIRTPQYKRLRYYGNGKIGRAHV